MTSGHRVPVRFGAVRNRQRSGGGKPARMVARTGSGAGRTLLQRARKVARNGPPYSIVGIEKLAPSFSPLGQRAVTVLVRV